LMSLTALPLGLYAAARHRRAGDYLAMAFSQIGIAVPSFWAGLLLIVLFSVRLGWVESGGFAGWSGGLWPAIRSLLLPAIALGLFQAAVLVRATRSAVLDVLREEYVRTARAKGVREVLVLGKHTLRNALIPVVTVAGIQLGQLMAGSLILESVFALPGLAITARLVLTAALSLGYTPSGPLAMSIATRVAGPSAAHPFGTDQYGRDVLSRIMRGAVTSIAVGVIAVGLGAAAGVLIGVLSGYAGGWLDEALMRLIDAVQGVPASLSALLCSAVFAPRGARSMIAIGSAHA